MNHSINDTGYQTPNLAPNKSMPVKQHRSIIDRLEGIMSLSQLLRFIGAAGILASMSLFMFKGWSDGNDISRYLKLLAQTGMITVAGLILSFVVKEAKGARVFFGLGLASVVANFTILGALTYSLLPLDSQLMDYPSMIRWEVTTLKIFIPTFLGALSLLSVVAFFGFSVFARRFAKPITLGFLALSALLLVPLRAPLAAAALAAVALAGAWFLIQRFRKHESFLVTFEIKVAFGLLLLPGAIIAVRALSFYNLDNISLMAFAALGFGILKALSNTLNPTRTWTRVLSGMQFALGIIIAYLLGETLPSLLNLYNYGFEGMIMAIALVAFAFEQVLNSDDKTWKQWLTSTVTLVIVPISLLSSLGNEFFFDSHAFQSLIVTGLVLALNIFSCNSTGTNNFSRTLSIVGFAIAFIIALFNIVEIVQLSNWVIVGVIGGAFIVSASFYERYGLRLNQSKKAIEG
jgi:hypothetical protein